jgi:hypothetical protein
MLGFGEADDLEINGSRDPVPSLLFSGRGGLRRTAHANVRAPAATDAAFFAFVQKP